MKRILITGASSGIGLASVKLALEQGFMVFGLDIHPSSFSISSKAAYTHIYADISDEQELKNVLRLTFKHEPLDALVCNAGIHKHGTVESTSYEDIKNILQINLFGTLHTLRASLPYLTQQKNSSIVLLGSDQSLVGKTNSSIYGLSKGAIAQLCKSTAIDYASKGVRVNCVCPGTIDTPLAKTAMKKSALRNNVSVEYIEHQVYEEHPLQRMGTSKEVAQLILFLCSDQSQFMTGSIVPIDGGYTAQ